MGQRNVGLGVRDMVKVLIIWIKEWGPVEPEGLVDKTQGAQLHLHFR
jgi:hypothetical protein